MSKAATILGVLLGVIILTLSMIDFSSGKILTAFFNWQGLLVVLGGTFAATLINYPLGQFTCFFKSIGKIFSQETASPQQAIEQIVDLSHLAQKKGVLELEKEIDFLEDKFLKFGITNLMIYRDEKSLRLSLEQSLNAMRVRHLTCQDVFNNMASYAPAFGMMGTVMGLIMMMTTQVAQDAVVVSGQGQDMLSALLQGMGLALVTTFYGVLFSNFLFIPTAGKLKVLSDAEVLKNQILIEGIMALKHEESPMMIREMLLVYVNDVTKQRLEQMIH